jgi:membrane protease YdiL (CAAX protease family)
MQDKVKPMKKLRAIFDNILYLVIIFLTRQIVYYCFSYYIFNSTANTTQAVDGEATLLFIRNASTIYQLIGWLIATVVIVGLIKMSKEKVLYQLKLKGSAVNLLLGCIIGFGIAFLTNGVVNSFSEFYSMPVTNVMENVYATNIMQTILLVGILTPIFEEVIFRGIIFDKLLKTGSKWFAIIMQGILFSISHISFVQGLYILPLGIITGYSVYKTKSVGTGIIIHIVFNVFNICLYYYNMNEYYVGQLITLIVLGLILIFFSVDKLSCDIFLKRKKGCSSK